MKRLTFIVCAVALSLGLMTTTTGCQSDKIPTYDKMYTYGTGAGVVGGIVCKIARIDTNSLNIACQIIEEVRSDIPSSNETFVAVWMPKIQTHLDDLKAKGKIDDAKYTRVLAAAKVGCAGLDRMFNKYPKAKEYQELVRAGVDGFVYGFEYIVKYDGKKLEAEVDGKKLEAEVDEKKLEAEVDEKEVESLCLECGVPYLSAAKRK